MKLSLVVPCYNESASLPALLEGFAGVLKRPDVELLLEDNGSSDGTQQVLSERLEKYPFARSVRVDQNQGYGYGILTGLRAARGDYLGWTHADLQTDPADALKALNEVERRGDPSDVFVKGHRRGRSLFDEIFTLGMSAFETAYLGCPLWDINAQPNIFHRSFYESWEAPPHDFALDLFVYYTARRQKLDIVRFDVVFPPRQHGESHWNSGWAAKWKFIRRTVDFSRSLKGSFKSKLFV